MDERAGGAQAPCILLLVLCDESVNIRQALSMSLFRESETGHTLTQAQVGDIDGVGCLGKDGGNLSKKWRTAILKTDMIAILDINSDP